jgi:hypothetical protein
VKTPDYQATVEKTGMDPLGTGTPEDERLREASQAWLRHRAAQREVVTRDFSTIKIAPAISRKRRQARG